MKRINIDNQITIATLKKIIRNSYFGDAINNAGIDNQTLENLDNGFISEKALRLTLASVFSEKKDGSFPKSTKAMFFTRNKIRFIKSILEQLLKESV